MLRLRAGNLFEAKEALFNVYFRSGGDFSVGKLPAAEGQKEWCAGNLGLSPVSISMCGIAVSLSSRDSPPGLSLEPLRHRGPDSQGEWRSPVGHVWLGHTRLAILDLSSAGAQ